MSDGFGRSQLMRCCACGEDFMATVDRGVANELYQVCGPCVTFQRFWVRNETELVCDSNATKSHTLNPWPDAHWNTETYRKRHGEKPPEQLDLFTGWPKP